MEHSDNFKDSVDKMGKALLVLMDVISHTASYDTKKVYTPRELEAYDSLTIRFLRAYEIFVGNVLKSCDFMFENASIGELKDRLNRAEKRGILDNVDEWMNMRRIRNVIAHEYVAEKLYEMDKSIRIWAKMLQQAFEKVKSVK
ncbi:MAG: hypothetical protein V1647_00645 [Pseudomonadota bacterium]